MVDGFACWVDPEHGGSHLNRFRAETRHRFGEEGQHPVDLAASFEVEYEREPEAPGQEIAPSWSTTGRLVLSKDLREEWNVTCNLDLGREFRTQGPDRWVPALALAVRYPREALLRYGAEFRQEFEGKHGTLLVPQLWLALPHEATFKVGVGFDPADAREDWFARTVFEIEL